jgi:lipopolysaccharide/colanic/teichoic acid biosynthesis glycosyltransferase
MNMPVSIRLELAIKRVADVLVAGTGIVVATPLLACIAAAIKLEDPRSPLFFNDRVMGRGESRFLMLKFRTMVPHEISYADRPEVHRDSPLVTRVGAVLRRWKLDELPQLLNVVAGHMSVVGPRPMDVARFERATPFQRQRLIVRPGLTGWAQVNGNINWSWGDRMEMDVWYLDRWSLALDLRILRATVPSILAGERHGGAPPSRVTDHSYRVPWPGFGRFTRGRSFDPADKVART